MIIKRVRFVTFLLLFLCLTESVFSFNTLFQNDSLSNNTYAKLEANFKQFQNDSVKAIIYANTHLLLAKESNNLEKIADSYLFISQISNDSVALLYTDSIIQTTKRLKKNTTYPALGYLQKGNIYYRNGNYKKALNQYLIASEYAKTRNKLQYYTIRFNIGLLKNFLNEREESLKVFIEYKEYISSSNIPNKNEYINKVLYAISDALIYSEKLDSAKLVIDEGIQKSLEQKDSLIYPYFILNSGIVNYFEQNYNIAIDSLKKSRQLLDFNQKQSSFPVSNLYIGKSLVKLGREDEAIIYFKTVDDFIGKTQDIFPELLEAYNYLIKFYKNKGDTKNQLYYIDKLIKSDSILHSNNTYLLKKIIKSYDALELISLKEQLIEELNKEQLLSSRTIILLIILAVLLSLIIFYYLRRIINYRKKFKELIEKLSANEAEEKEKSRLAAPENISKENIALPDEIVKDILRKLEKFEQSNRFTKRNYTLTKVAKEFETNSSYLSKVINVSKKANFSNYLNDLRIEFAVRKLKSNPQFRSYTIKAIANEVGFNNAQSFSNAFHKKTGIYPSYFIKKIDTVDEFV